MATRLYLQAKERRSQSPALGKQIFTSLVGKTMEVYVDDMIVKSKQDTEHDRDLREFLKSFEDTA